ncbi:hypothetical protein QYM36_015702 [Artemia franciscana]|uniref:Reverse transcriptase domain-containing protein n=1 Tax=Artemia franciscana TaxID=6661 RepID=A0AA88HID6_ARTSF|nr:hypothetical protein QYM36_015702 [Artemia franciscana]
MLIKSSLSYRSLSYGGKADNVSRILQKSCPQGSILSPFLWSVNVDDPLRSELPTCCTIRAYPDDICVTVSSKDANFLDHTAKKIFTLFEKWADKNKLKFDVNKCEAIIFTKKREIPQINLQFLSHRIPISDEIRWA